MELELTSDDMIRCHKCHEEMDIRHAVHTPQGWQLVHAEPGGLVCPFCSGKEIERLKQCILDTIVALGGNIDGP